VSNLAEELPKEINSVREIQDQYKELLNMPGVIVAPQIMLMEHAIQRAIKASAAGDTIQMIRAFEELRRYEA
jgi:hypothetical protein